MRSRRVSIESRRGDALDHTIRPACRTLTGTLALYTRASRRCIRGIPGVESVGPRAWPRGPLWTSTTRTVCGTMRMSSYESGYGWIASEAPVRNFEAPGAWCGGTMKIHRSRARVLLLSRLVRPTTMVQPHRFEKEPSSVLGSLAPLVPISRPFVLVVTVFPVSGPPQASARRFSTWSPLCCRTGGHGCSVVLPARPRKRLRTVGRIWAAPLPSADEPGKASPPWPPHSPLQPTGRRAPALRSAHGSLARLGRKRVSKSVVSTPGTLGASGAGIARAERGVGGRFPPSRTTTLSGRGRLDFQAAQSSQEECSRLAPPTSRLPSGRERISLLRE